MSSEDGEQGIIEPEKVINCSLKTFIASNWALLLFSLGMAIFGALGVVFPGNALALFSPQVFSAMIAFGGLGLITMPLGIVGRRAGVEILFLVYLLLLSLGIVAQTLALCFFILYFNDAGSIFALKDATVNADDVFVTNIEDLANGDADLWKETQDHFDCCGVDFEIRLDDDDSVSTFETGDRCSDDGVQEALSLLEVSLEENVDVASSFDEFGNFIEALEDETVGIDALFFCKFAMSEKMDANLPTAIAISVVLIILQITAIVSASRLYWVPDYLGGWYFDESALEQVAVNKGLEMPKFEQTEDKNIFSTLRNQAQRVSFRLQNAYTADPSNKATSLFGRLSINRDPSARGTSFQGAASFQGQAPADMAEAALRATSLQDLDKYDEQQPADPSHQSGKSFFSRMSMPTFGRASKAPPGMPARNSNAQLEDLPTNSNPFSPPPPKATLESGDGKPSAGPPPGL